MGRKKKKSDNGIRPPREENIAAEGADFVRMNTGEMTLNEGEENLTKSPKRQSGFTDLDENKEKPSDVKEDADKMCKENATHKRRLFGRRRIRSVSSKRGNAREQGMRKELQNESSVTSEVKQNTSSSSNRMSRKEKFYSENPEITPSQTSKDEFKIKVTVDSPDEETTCRKVGREKESRKDFVDSTTYRRRFSNKRIFKISQRCPIPSCWKHLKSQTKKRRENINGKQKQFNLTNKHDTETQQTADNQRFCQIETESEVVFERMPTKGKNFRKTGPRKKVRAKGSNDMKRDNAQLPKQKKPRSTKAITNCCGVRKKTSRNQSMEVSENESPPEVYPVSMEPKSTERIKSVKVTSESHKRAVQLSKAEPKDSKQDNYPEELNPFADEYISENVDPGRSVPSTEPGIQKTSDKIKTVENPEQNRADDYPEHLNPFSAAEETNEVEGTEEQTCGQLNARTGKPLELNEVQVKTSAASVGRSRGDTGKKSRLHLRWRQLNATGFWLSKKNNRKNKTYIKHPKTKAIENRSDHLSLSSNAKDNVKQPDAEERKGRRRPCKWGKVKRMRNQLTNKKTKRTEADDTQRKHNNNEAPVKPATYLTTSSVDTQETTSTKKKILQFRLHIRKRKDYGKESKKTESVEQETKLKTEKKYKIFKIGRNQKHSAASQKETDQRKSDSVDQLSKSKSKKNRRWFKRKRTQKELGKCENEVIDGETSEIAEDHKVVYKSKYLQNLNPLTASHIKPSVKEQPVRNSSQKGQMDTKIKHRRWWKIGKLQKPRDTTKPLSKEDEITNYRPSEPVEDIGGKDTTDLHKKKKSLLNRLKKALNPRNKSLTLSNSHSGPVICDSKSDEEKDKGSSKTKGKVEMKSGKTVKKSLSPKESKLKDPKPVKPRSTITKLRKGWKKFNQWLDE